jgi:hypothetical protein
MNNCPFFIQTKNSHNSALKPDRKTPALVKPIPESNKKPVYKLVKSVCPITSDVKYNLVNIEELENNKTLESIPEKTEEIVPLKETIQSEEKIIQKESENPILQYRLEKYEESDQIKYKLVAIKKDELEVEEKKEKEIIEQHEKDVAENYEPGDKEIQEEVNQVEEPSEIPDDNNGPQINYRLEKTVDENTGLTKYILKENFAIAPEISQNILSNARCRDDEPESVCIKDLIQNNKKDIVVYRNILKKKLRIDDFRGESNLKVLLGENKLLYRDFNRRRVIENSHLLYHSTVLEFISLRILTRNLNTPVQIYLSIYNLNASNQEFNRIQRFDLSEFPVNGGKIITKAIDYVTPRNGSFISVFLEIKSINQEILEQGNISIEYNIECINKQSREKTINLAEINSKLEVD